MLAVEGHRKTETKRTDLTILRGESKHSSSSVIDLRDYKLRNSFYMEVTTRNKSWLHLGIEIKGLGRAEPEKLLFFFRSLPIQF